MKALILLVFPVLLLFSCKKGNDLPREETITVGSKWGLVIGSSAADVYSRLQELSKEKTFTQVGVSNRQPYTTPQQIQHLLPFYDFLLQRMSNRE